MNSDIFVTDGGLETFMIMKEGWDLPGFGSFVLLDSEEGCGALNRYYRRYLSIAREHNCGFILESPTWRANPAWLERLGYEAESLDRFNHRAIRLLHRIREGEDNGMLILISGCIGPRDDGYRSSLKMSPGEAEEFHTSQISAFREIGADMVTALTINYVEEAIGIVRAAASEQMPVVVSFTVEKDGRLPSGESLREAVQRVDVCTNQGAEYFMINCSHPTHILPGLRAGEAWTERILGIRANASSLSHEELDQAEELDEGDPVELAEQYVYVRNALPILRVLGGCCGTDHRHVEEICRAYLS
jgi:S-methylmethionine-dependent homocysteine/selenocysteine methylase